MPDVLEVHELPSVEVSMVPELPTATKVLLPYVTPLSDADVIFMVIEVHELPSIEVRMLAESPTATIGNSVVNPFVISY